MFRQAMLAMLAVWTVWVNGKTLKPGFFVDHPCRVLDRTLCFAEDFNLDNGNPEGDDWEESGDEKGEWSQEDGVLTQTKREGKILDFEEDENGDPIIECPRPVEGSALLARAVENFASRDIVFKAKATMRSSGDKGPLEQGSFGLVWHAEGKDEMYIFDWAAADGCYAMWKRDGGRGRDFDALKDGAKSMTRGREYQLEVRVEGKEFEFYIDGELIEKDDDGKFDKGAFGLWTSISSSVVFDDVIAVVLEMEDYLSPTLWDPPEGSACETMRPEDCFEADFSRERDIDERDKDDEDWFADGAIDADMKWEIKDGRLEQTDRGGDSNSDVCVDSLGVFAYAVKSSLVYAQEKIIAVQWRTDEKESIGLMFNVQPPQRGIREIFGYYRLDHNHDAKCFTLTRHSQGESALIATIDKELDEEETHNIELRMFFTRTELYIDGDLEATFPELDITFGGIALYCYKNDECFFESAVVVSMDASNGLFEECSGSSPCPPSDPSDKTTGSKADKLHGKRFVGTVNSRHYFQILNDRTIDPTPRCTTENEADHQPQRASATFDATFGWFELQIEQVVDEKNRRYYPGENSKWSLYAAENEHIKYGPFLPVRDNQAPSEGDLDTYCDFVRTSDGDSVITVNFRGRSVPFAPLSFPILEERAVGPNRPIFVTIAGRDGADNEFGRILKGVGSRFPQITGLESAFTVVGDNLRSLGQTFGRDGFQYVGANAGNIRAKAGVNRLAYPRETLGSTFLDATSDGMFNYAVASSGSEGEVPVFRFNLDWTAAEFLFNHQATRCSGIAYDAINRGLFLLCDNKISARRIASGLLTPPEITLPSNGTGTFLAYEVVQTLKLWTSMAPGTLTEIDPFSGKVTVRDLEIDNLDDAPTLRAGEFQPAARKRFAEAGIPENALSLTPHQRYQAAEHAHFLTMQAVHEQRRAAAKEQRKRTAFGCTAAPPSIEFRPTCGTAEFFRPGRLREVDDDAVYDENFPPVLTFITPEKPNQVFRRDESMRLKVVCIGCVGDEEVHFELLDEDGENPEELDTDKLGERFPFGHDASIKVDKLSGKFYAGKVQVRAFIPDVPGDPEVFLDVDIRCRACEEASGDKLSSCAPGCTDSINGCVELDGLKQCFGEPINCRRVVAGWKGSICERYAEDAPPRCLGPLSETNACSDENSFGFCREGLDTEQNDGGRCLDVRCKKPGKCLRDSDALQNNAVDEVCFVLSEKGQCPDGEGCDFEGQCVPVQPSPAPTNAPTPQPTPPPTVAPTPGPPTPVPITAAPTPLPPAATNAPTPRPTPVPATPAPSPAPTPRPTPSPTPFPTPAPTPARVPCDDCKVFGMKGSAKWCRCCSLDCNGFRDGCVKDGMCSIDATGNKICGNVAFCVSFVQPGKPTPAPLPPPDPPCLSRQSCGACVGPQATGSPCAFCELSGGGYCDDLDAPRMVECGDRPGPTGGRLFFGGDANRPLCSAPDRCAAFSSGCDVCLQNGCGYCRDKFGQSRCYGVGYKQVCQQDAGFWFDACPTRAPTPNPTPNPTPVPPTPAPTPVPTPSPTAVPPGPTPMPTPETPKPPPMVMGGTVSVIDPVSGRNVTITFTLDGDVTSITDEDGNDVADEFDVQVGPSAITLDAGGDTVIAIDRITLGVNPSSTETADGVAVQPPCDAADAVDSDGDGVIDCVDDTLTLTLGKEDVVFASFYRLVGPAPDIDDVATGNTTMGGDSMVANSTMTNSTITGNSTMSANATVVDVGMRRFFAKVGASGAGLSDAPAGVVDVKVEYLGASAGVSSPTRGYLSSAVRVTADAGGATLRDKFAPEVSICVPVTSQGAEMACLASFDEASEDWVCADESLEEEDGLLCGTTSHFTLFAVIDPTDAERAGPATPGEPTSTDSPRSEVVEEPGVTIVPGLEDLYFFIACGVGGCLLITLCVICCVCISRRNKDDDDLASSPGLQYQVDTSYEYTAPPPINTDEFMSARDDYNEMSPVLPGPPAMGFAPPPSVGYTQASLARKDLEVEYIEEISDSSGDSDGLVIGI